MTEQQTIPAGYRQDAQGRLIPESMIKPIDVERDRLVRGPGAPHDPRRFARAGYDLPTLLAPPAPRPASLAREWF